MAIYKRYEDVVQDTAGNVVQYATVTVANWDGATATVYSDRTGAGGPVTPTFTTDSKGRFGFYAPDGLYRLTITTAAGSTTTKNDVVIGSGFNGDDFRQVFNPDYYGVGASDQAAVQACMEAAKLTGGIVRLQARTYTFTTLTKYNNVSLQGTGFFTIIEQDPSAIGPLILDYPYVGTSTATGGKSRISHMQLKGNLVGITKATGTVTLGSGTISGISSTVGFANGYLIEGVGIPDFTTISSFTSNSVVMAGGVTGTLTATSTKLVVRPAYAVTATSVAGSKTVTVTAGSMASIAAGMKASGTNLEVDGDDLNKNTRVSSVNQANQTITLDRPCAVSGSFSLLCYVKNALILVPEPFYNPSYDSGKEYRAPTIDGVQMTQAGGDGIVVRPGRDQFHLTASSKVVNCYGRGVSMVGSNDSQIDTKVGIGGHWEEALLISASSTPRVIGIDCWDTQLVDKCYDFVIRGCRQAHVVAGDLNGRMYVKGKTGETNGLVRVSGLNWKWHTGDSFPDGTSDQFLLVDNATVVLDSPYFYGDRTDNNAPNYLATVQGGGLLTITGARILTDAVDVARPYKVGLFNVTSGSVRGWYIDHTGAMVRMGDVVGVADGSNAATGAVGEEINMKVASSSAVSLTTNGITNLGSLSLTAGDWDQCATAHFICTGATITGLHLGMPGNTNTIPIAPQQSAYMNVPVTGFTGTLSVVLPPFRNSLSTTSTERTNVRAVFSAGTVTAYGSSRARRVR